MGCTGWRIKTLGISGLPSETLFLTPHAAEAARLLGRSVTDVTKNTVRSVADMAERFQATCLLKGPGTVMGDRHSQAICGHGNPGMATAGMGDVLAGLPVV